MKKTRAMWLLRAAVVSASIGATRLVAQPPDTTTTKDALIAADRALSVAVSIRGAATFLSALEDRAPVLFAGQTILRGAAEARAPFLARYGAPSAHSWHVAAAVASADPSFGCTTGFSRFTAADDSTHTERGGTYLTCWRRGANGAWKIAGHQRSDAPASAEKVPEGATLSAAPHSATVSHNGSGLKGAQDADAAFAKMGAEPAGPGPAFEKYAAVDAMFPGSATPVLGKAEIRKGFDAFPSTRVLLWEPTRDAGLASGGLAFTVGLAVNKQRDGQGPENFTKYLTVWRLEPNGEWAWIFDLGSPRPAPR